MGLAFNLILMYIFVGMMLLQPMFAKVLASCIVVIWNYLARKKWIFDQRVSAGNIGGIVL